jgi:glycosyltransferase involved in cell wall biosynthesis
MEKLPSLSLFFPAFNEAQNIEQTINRAQSIAPHIAHTYEILIIDDGSQDQTAAIVTSLAEKIPQVQLIQHPYNLGYGAAILTGLTKAQYEWIFFSDGDGQFDLEDLRSFVPYTQEFDVIIGYRAKRQDSLMRIINAKGWNVLNRIFFGLSVRDIDCAFKLIRTNTVKPLLPHTRSHGAMISAELLIRLLRSGARFKELPVHHQPRTAGRATGAKPQVILRAFREMAYAYRGDLGPNWAQNVSKYLLFGVFNTISDLGAFFILILFSSTLAAHVTWAKAISYIIGLLQSYLFNQLLTHQTSRLTQIRFFLIGIASLAINTGIMYVAYNTLHAGTLFSVLLATFLTFSWNYALSKTIDLQT